jgi:hypothetical protein
VQPHPPRAAELAVCDETIEERFQTGKGLVGLDQHQVRRFDAWYRHVTLVLVAQAFLAAVRAQAALSGRAGAGGG